MLTHKTHTTRSSVHSATQKMTSEQEAVEHKKGEEAIKDFSRELHKTALFNIKSLETCKAYALECYFYYDNLLTKTRHHEAVSWIRHSDPYFPGTEEQYFFNTWYDRRVESLQEEEEAARPKPITTTGTKRVHAISPTKNKRQRKTFSPETYQALNRPMVYYEQQLMLFMLKELAGVHSEDAIRFVHSLVMERLEEKKHSVISLFGKQIDEIFNYIGLRLL